MALLAAFAGSQPAAAQCAMELPAGGATAAEPAHHGHHGSTDVPADEQVPASPDAGACVLMMACGAAVPTPAVASEQPADAIDVSSFTPGAAYASPSLAFDPPPPRHHLS